jgi:hypothetical protein
MHANTVRVLRQMFGIDISGQRPQHLDAVVDRRFDHVITLCDRAREACPEFPTTRGVSTGASPTRPPLAMTIRPVAGHFSAPPQTSIPASGTCCPSLSAPTGRRISRDRT